MRSWAIVTLTFALAGAVSCVREGLSDDYAPGGNADPAGNFGAAGQQLPGNGPALSAKSGGYFQGPPSAPGDAVRPSSWPGGPPSPGPQAPANNPQQPPQFAPAAIYCAPFPTPPPDLCASALALGRIGSEYVQCADILTGLDQFLERNSAKRPPAEYEKERRANVEQIMEAINDFAAHINDRDPVAAMLPSHRTLIKNLLNHQVETKLMYNDARRTIPDERLPTIEEAISKEFDKTTLDKLMKRLGVQSRRELDDKLRSMGSSLEHEKRAFTQQMLGQEWVGQQVKADEEITQEQMLQWYQTHLSRFETPCRAKWEELMVRIAKYPSKADAYAAIARMGNQVLAGTPLAQVAREQSDGSTALSGGFRDWISKGSFAVEKVDQALFGLPIGQLSPILEGETGFYIVRVLDRQEVTRKPFADVQDEIKKKIREEKVSERFKEYLAKLRRETPVWTIFDDFDAAAERVTSREDAPRY